MARLKGFNLASTAVASPSVGPSVGWNGTGGSGGSAPTQNTRTVVQITAAYTVVPYQRVNEGTFSLRVKADPADLGVTFSGDCVTTTVTTPKLVYVPTVHGTTRHEYVYEILMDIDAFLAQNASVNTVHIYANCQSSDPNMCNRVLGPFIFYPESSANDGAATGVWSKTFSLGGVAADYSSLSAAITAANTAITGGKTATLLTCIETGFYTATNLGTAGLAARGYSTITHAPGIVCTIGRTSVANYNNETTWWWTPGLRGIEFRGSGIVFDNANYTYERWTNSANSKAPWYNGCKWTDSLGRDRLWNGTGHPGRGPSGNNTFVVEAYFTDCTWEEGVTPYVRTDRFAIGSRTNNTYGDLYTSLKLVSNTYDTNSTSAYFRTTPAAITIQYSGTNTATIEKASTGTNGGYGANSAVILRENGTIVATLLPQQYANQANTASNMYWTWAEMATCINALSGWTATVNDTTGRQARHNFGDTRATSASIVNYWNAYDCKTTPFVMRSIIDVHGDWYQKGYTSNVIIANCVTAGLDNDYSGMFFMGEETDTLVENCIMIAHAANGTGWSGAHFRYRNNTVGDSGTGFQTNTSVYSEFSNTALSNISGTANNNPSVRNNYYTTGTFPTGTNTSGSFTGGTFSDQFVDDALDVVDMRPQGVLLSNLVATLPSCPYDIMGNLRSAMDCAGAVSKNQATAPIFPLVT